MTRSKIGVASFGKESPCWCALSAIMACYSSRVTTTSTVHTNGRATVTGRIRSFRASESASRRLMVLTVRLRTSSGVPRIPGRDHRLIPLGELGVSPCTPHRSRNPLHEVDRGRPGAAIGAPGPPARDHSPNRCVTNGACRDRRLGKPRRHDTVLPRKTRGGPRTPRWPRADWYRPTRSRKRRPRHDSRPILSLPATPRASRGHSATPPRSTSCITRCCVRWTC